MPDQHSAQTDGDRLAVGAFTAMATLDYAAAQAVLADAGPDELRAAVLTLAGAMTGIIITASVDRGLNPLVVLAQSARDFGQLTRMRGDLRA